MPGSFHARPLLMPSRCAIVTASLPCCLNSASSGFKSSTGVVSGGVWCIPRAMPHSRLVTDLLIERTSWRMPALKSVLRAKTESIDLSLPLR